MVPNGNRGAGYVGSVDVASNVKVQNLALGGFHLGSGILIQSCRSREAGGRLREDMEGVQSPSIRPASATSVLRTELRLVPLDRSGP